MLRDGDRREKELRRGVYSSGWAIGWVTFAGNKCCVGGEDIRGAGGQEGMDAFEDFVDEFVSVSANPPAFDDTGIVAVDGDVLWAANAARESKHKELESDCLCPGNVLFSFKCLPAWDKSPGSPSLTNDDSNTDARASIREGVVVSLRRWWGDAVDGCSI